MNAHITLEFVDENMMYLNSKLDKVFYSIEDFAKYLEECTYESNSAIPSKAVYYTIKVYKKDCDSYIQSYTKELFV